MWAVLAAVGSCLFVLPAHGQLNTVRAPAANKPQEKTIGPFAGTVRDPAGKPAGGVKIILLTMDWQHTNADATSDANGRFQINKKVNRDAYLDHFWPSLWFAHDEQGRIGGYVQRVGRGRNPSVDPMNVEIKLNDVKDCQGRLVDAAGQPIAKATIQPQGWQSSEEMYHQQVVFPTEWRKKLTANTDSDGRFTLHDMPTPGTIGVKICAEGFGEPLASWPLEKSPTLTLARVGAVKVSAICEKDPKAADGIKLRLSLDYGWGPYSPREDVCASSITPKARRDRTDHSALKTFRRGDTA